jgi:hypothetical protein
VIGQYDFNRCHDAPISEKGNILVHKDSVDFLDDPAVQRRREKMKKRLARLGYSLMHRRNGQFWLIYDEPMTLNEIEEFIEAQRRH